MSNRVSVSITIGGDLAAHLGDQLVALVDDYCLSIEWDGPAFDAAHLPDGGPLVVCAHETAWGSLPDLEAFCVEHHLPFVLRYGGYPGEWSAGRTVFRGEGESESYLCDDSDATLIDRATVEHFGNIEAILAHFDAADFVVPPLRLIG